MTGWGPEAMFDKNRLQEILVQYKKDFADFVWNNERYKWVAAQNFQDNWDVNAENFAEMLTKSLSKAANLLASMNNFPARMISLFAKTSPEEVRAMFLRLFDEPFFHKETNEFCQGVPSFFSHPLVSLFECHILHPPFLMPTGLPNLLVQPARQV